MNYGEFENLVTGISHRADLTADIPVFVELAEASMAKDLRAIEMLKRITLTEADRIEENIYDLPLDFLEEHFFRTPPGVEGCKLKKISLTSEQTYPRNSSGVWAFSLSGDNEVSPVEAQMVAFINTPATDAEIEVSYWQRQRLDTSTSTATNALLTNHPDLYLVGVLGYLYQKTQDLELAQGNASQFVSLINVLNEQAGRYLGGTIAKPVYNLGNYRSPGGY